MSWQTLPICEQCWIDQNSEHVMTERGPELVKVRMPIRLSEVTLEQCHRCKTWTISGIYVREQVEG